MCIRKLSIILLIAILDGCAGVQIDSAISQYDEAKKLVKLGDDRDHVMSIMLPTQKGISSRYKKQPESYLEDGKTVEIYYFRTGRQPDNLTTDDEFTPYVFTNGVLTAIGWTTLGGPQSRGQVIQPAPQIKQNVEVNQ